MCIDVGKVELPLLIQCLKKATKVDTYESYKKKFFGIENGHKISTIVNIHTIHS